MDDPDKFASLRANDSRLSGAGTNSVFEDIHVYTAVRPSPPPPLPGVFVVDPPKRQIVPQSKSSFNSSSKPLPTTYMHHNNKNGNFSGAIPSPSSNQTRFNNHTTMYPNQNEFLPSSLDMFDYPLDSDEKDFSTLQPILQRSDESLLPAEENIYHTLQPVPHTGFDMPPSSESKVYQQLQPVLQNDFEFNMQKSEVPLGKSYQQGSGLPIVGSLSHKKEMKTYQDLSSSGLPNSLIRNTKSAQPLPIASSYNPPYYASSKLYQQLRQPLNKTAKISYHPSDRTFCNVRPVAVSSFKKPGHPHCNQLGQQTFGVANKMFATQGKTSTFTQLQRVDDSTHFQGIQDLIEARVSLPNNISNTHNAKPQPNLQSKYSPTPQDKGYQSNNPKVYLQLRSPSIREQVQGTQLNFQTSDIDSQYVDSNPGYKRSRENCHRSQQMQLPFEKNGNQHKLARLPGPYEFNLSQNNSEANKLPKILCPEEYTTSPERNQHSSFNLNVESLVSSSTIQSPLNSVPSTLSGSPGKQNKTLLSLPKVPVCYGDSNVSSGTDYQITSVDYDNLNSIPSFNEMLPSTNTPCSKTESRFSNKSNNILSVPDSKLQELLTATNLVHKRTLSATKEQQNEEKTNKIKGKRESYVLNHVQATYSPTTIQNSFSQNHGHSSLEQLSNNPTFRNNCLSIESNQTSNSKQTASTEIQSMPPQNHKNNSLESLGRPIDKYIVDAAPQDSWPIKRTNGNNQTLKETQNSFSVDIKESVPQNENIWKLNEKNASVVVSNTNRKSKVVNQISEENTLDTTSYDQRKNFQNNTKSPQEIKKEITNNDGQTDENDFNRTFIERSIYSHRNIEDCIFQNSKTSEENADKTVHNDSKSLIKSDSVHGTQFKTSECSPKHLKKCTSLLETNSENKIVNITTPLDRFHGKCHVNANYPLNNPLSSAPSNGQRSQIIEETASATTINEERNSNNITEGLIRILQEKTKHLSRIQNCNSTVPPTGNVEDLIFNDRSPEQMRESINGKHFMNSDNNVHVNITSDSSTKIDKLNKESVSVVKVPENTIPSLECKQDSICDSSPFEQLKANSEAVICNENEASHLQQPNKPESFNDNSFPEINELPTNIVPSNSNPAPTTFSESPTNLVSTSSSENLVRKYKKRKYVTSSPKTYDSCELPIEQKTNHGINSKNKLPTVPKVLISLRENSASRPSNVSEQNLGKRSVKKIDYKILNGGDDDEEDEIIIKKRKYHKSAKWMNHFKFKKIKSKGLLTFSVESMSSKSSADSGNGIPAKPHEFKPPGKEPSIVEDEGTGIPKKRKYTKRAVTTKKNVDMEWDEQEYDSSKKCKYMKEGDDFSNKAECSKYLNTDTVKQEFIDPLEEGLISDNDDEVVFLGFDMPPEEDETILGFDFSPAKEDLDPVNFLCEQLEADCVTVECDPRFLFQSTPTPCPQCTMKFTSHQDLVDHLQWHSGAQSNTFACDFCKREFSSQGSLDKHIKWNHRGKKRFSCPICPKCFTTKQYVKKHVETIHKQKIPKAKFFCAECVHHFPSEKLLKKHEDKVHKKQLYQCNKCLKYYEKLSNLQRHELSHSEEALTFPCAYCTQQFTSKELLHAHWQVHKNKKKYKCEFCEREFTASNSLKRHKLLHAKEKLFRCEICQRSFNYLSTLKTHLLIHTGARRFECRLCHKTFNRRDVLNAHQWTHTGEKKFQCDICKERFRWRHAVKSHKLIYHSTEKPFICQTCGKRFSHPDSFKKHAQVHSERLHYCQICLKSFSRLNTLKIHLITHTDHKPFFCDVCKRGFRSKSHLRGHFLTHTKEKPWLCKFCNKTFKDCYQLRRHKRAVHCKAFYKKVLRSVPECRKTVNNIEEISNAEQNVQNEDEGVLNKTENSD